MSSVTKSARAGASTLMFFDATIPWAKPGFIVFSDDSYAGATFSGAISIADLYVQLFSGLSQIGDNKAKASAWLSSDSTSTYGNSSDLWGTTLTAELINNSSFGFFVVATPEFGIGEPPVQTYSLVASNFGFSIPTGSTIDGIVAQIEKKAIPNARAGTTAVTVDHMQMTVHYTEPPPVGNYRRNRRR